MRRRDAGPVRTTALSVVLAAVTLASTLALPAAPVAARPKAVADAVQMAYASNIVRHAGANYFIVAGATRRTNPAGKTITTAFAQRSKCATLHKKRITLIACAAYVFPRKVPARVFDFDPLMQSARLHLTSHRTALSWAGRGTPSPDAAPWADPGYGAVAGVDASRGARVDGRILGSAYPAHKFAAFGFLDEGAQAAVLESAGAKVVAGSPGVLVFRARYRVPR